MDNFDEERSGWKTTDKVTDRSGQLVDRWRWDSGELFEFCPESHSYYFVASGEGKSFAVAVAEYEEYVDREGHF